MKKIIFNLLIILTLVSCANEPMNTEIPIEFQDEIEAVPVSKPTNREQIFTLYVESDYELSLYESEKGVYLGAYILDDLYNNDIAEFEQHLGKEHASYIYYMKLGDEFPLNFILSCIANDKIPNIAVDLPNEHVGKHIQDVKKLAEEFSQFPVPMFIQFAPFNSKYNVVDYIDLYKQSRQIFKHDAPNIAFIWKADMQNVFDSMRYYPGDEYVDWVGLDVLHVLDLNEEQFFNQNMYKALDFFYYTFQEQKPIMLTNFGISHFNNKSYTYKINEAKDEILNTYRKIVQEYPRIKGIYYVNYDEANLGLDKEVFNNFLISENETLIEAYNEATSNERFLLKLNEPTTGRNIKELIKSPFDLYSIGSDLLISENSLIYNMDLKDLDEFKVANTINSKNYYKISEIEKKVNGSFIVNSEERKIIYTNS